MTFSIFPTILAQQNFAGGKYLISFFPGITCESRDGGVKRPWSERNKGGRIF